MSATATLTIHQGLTAEMQPFADAFANAAASRTHEPEWLRHQREAAIARAATLGFPAKSEWWKHTSVKPIARGQFVPAPVADAKAAPDAGLKAEFEAAIRAAFIADFDATTLVFVNGRFVPTLSSAPLDAGIKVGTLTAALADNAERLDGALGAVADFEQQPFTALNTAFWADGAFVYLPRNADLDKPVHLVFASVAVDGKPTANFPRTFVFAGTSTRVDLVETHLALGDTPTFSCPVTEVIVGANAHVEHIKIQRKSAGHFHVAAIQARLEADARFRSHNFSLGAEIVRNDIGAKMAAENAEATLNGLTIGTGNVHVDNHTELLHDKPNCQSHELYKHLLTDAAHAVFYGRIVVAEHAQKTDAFQSNRTLLLSDRAAIDAMPQLEIYADDVKCSHGATTGRLDADSLFYLQSRGVDAALARVILSHAFAGEVIDEVGLEPVRVEMQKLLAASLATDARFAAAIETEGE